MCPTTVSIHQFFHNFSKRHQNTLRLFHVQIFLLHTHHCTDRLPDMYDSSKGKKRVTHWFFSFSFKIYQFIWCNNNFSRMSIRFCLIDLSTQPAYGKYMLVCNVSEWQNVSINNCMQIEIFTFAVCCALTCMRLWAMPRTKTPNNWRNHLLLSTTHCHYIKMAIELIYLFNFIERKYLQIVVSWILVALVCGCAVRVSGWPSRQKCPIDIDERFN